MVDGDASLDAKTAAAKVMAEKIGNLLDIRGFDVIRRKPYANENRCEYGVDFGFDPAGPLTEGIGVKLRYFANETPDRLSLKFHHPSYEGHDGRVERVSMEGTRDQVSESMSNAKDEELKRVCQNLLEKWDDSFAKRFKKNVGHKAWRRCTLGSGALSNIESVVKWMEKMWQFYLAKYQFAKVEAVRLGDSAQAFRDYLDSVKKTLGGNGPNADRRFGASMVYGWSVGDLGQVNMQIDTEPDGNVVINAIKMNKDRAEDFLKHLMKWRNN